MNPQESITLASFLEALDQLDSIPFEVSSKLKDLVPMSSDKVSRLKSIAELHSPLYKLYKEARFSKTDHDSERNKGPKPDKKCSSSFPNEIVNFVDVDRQFLSLSPDPVSTINKIGILERLLTFFKQHKP
ncbi:MAG: hypothetical protein ACK5C4_10340 [Pseudanabaena sp.]